MVSVDVKHHVYLKPTRRWDSLEPEDEQLQHQRKPFSVQHWIMPLLSGIPTLRSPELKQCIYEQPVSYSGGCFYIIPARTQYRNASFLPRTVKGWNYPLIYTLLCQGPLPNEPWQLSPPPPHPPIPPELTVNIPMEL